MGSVHRVVFSFWDSLPPINIKSPGTVLLDNTANRLSKARRPTQGAGVAMQQFDTKNNSPNR